jgi:hypothetical protein
MNASYQRERRARRRRERRQVCASCHDVFVPSRSDQLYCSVACKGRDARRRRKVGETPARRRPSEPPFIEPDPMPVVERPAERPGESQDEIARRRADFIASLIA